MSIMMKRDPSLVSDTRPDREQEPTHEKHPPPPSRSLARSIALVTTCTAAMMVTNATSTSVGIALPNIGKSIDIQEDQLQWLLSAYSLSSGCLLLFFGRLADLYGRKKAFSLGMFWQMVFALGCGFAKDGVTLDVLRGLQGVGAAATIPSALGILAHSFPPSRARSIAFATFAAGSPVGAAFGAVIGGVVTQLSSQHWRATFFLSTAFSALCFLGGLVSIDADEISSEVDRRIDWVGAMLVTAGLVLITFVLGQGPIVGWKSAYMIVCLILGVTLVGIFILWERHLENVLDGPEKTKSFWTPPPLMKPSIWARANGRMGVILVIAFLNWSGFWSWTFWVQPHYQNYLQLSPLLTMVRFIPMFVMGCLCNVFVAMFVGRLPLVVFIVSGTLITGAACVLYALINPSVTYWAFGFPSTLLVVFGADFVYAAGTIFIAKVSLPHEHSVTGGVFQTMTQIGTAFGLTISTIVFDKVSNGQDMLPAYKAAQWTGAAFPFLAALLAAVFLRGVGIVGHGKPSSADETGSEKTVTEYPAEQISV